MPTSQQTTIVNIRKEACDVYIGRACRGHPGSPFGNPFKVGRDGGSDECLVKFEAWFHERLRADPAFRAQVLALKGKRLGCWCYPARCHGDILAEWLDGFSETEEAARQKEGR